MVTVPEPFEKKVSSLNPVTISLPTIAKLFTKLECVMVGLNCS